MFVRWPAFGNISVIYSRSFVVLQSQSEVLISFQQLHTIRQKLQVILATAEKPEIIRAVRDIALILPQEKFRQQSVG